MIFRPIISFNYKNQEYQLFLSEKSYKYAFLKNNHNELTYPTLDELIELTKVWGTTKYIYDIKNDSKKRVRFIPKIKYNGMLLILTTSLLTGCSNYYNKNTSIFDSPGNTYNYQEPNKYPQDTTNTENKNNNSNEIDFEKLLAPADDEYDYKYASDHIHYKYSDKIYFYDINSFQKALNIPDITIDDIKTKCNKNKNISKEYKDFIIEYVTNWQKMYPNSNFAVLYANLETLKIKEVSKYELASKALSMDSAACYKPSENTIYVLNDIDISRESDGYIILTHELTHAARQSELYDKKAKLTYRIGFNEKYAVGTYAEEALITDFAYEMQGLNNKSSFYALLSSYFRIILEAIDYNGSDYMNHSVNYLIEKMNEYTGNDDAAYIIALLEAQATIRYTEYMTAAYTEFDDLYDYIVKLYMSKHLNENMSYDEALVEFDNFYDEINYHFTDIYSAYGITKESFEKGFNESLEKYNIQSEKELRR